MPNQTTRQDRLLAILVLIIGVVVGYLYYAQVASTNVSIFPPLKADGNDSLAKFKNVNLNFQIFDSTNFKSLKTFGEVPVPTGQPGKPDIFGSF